MRLDDAGPRTWVVAAVAGWALAAWLLAAVGRGGRVEPLPDDPGLLKRLPPVRPSPPLRLGPIGQYDAIARRPLFSEDRQPQPFFLQGEGEQFEDAAFDYVLTSVLISPRLEMAILQPAAGGESVRVKLEQAPESHPAWRLVGLNQRSAVFEGREGPLTLQLRVYDGIGGAAPTRVAAPPQPQPGRGLRLPAADRARADAQRTDAVTTAEAEARAPAEPESESEPTAPVDAGQADDADAGAESDADAEAPPSGFADEMTEESQMQAIRDRIEARRAKLRDESQSKPPAESP